MIAMDCKRDIAATSTLTSGKAISKAIIKVELSSGYAAMQTILNFDSSGNLIDSPHEVVPKVQLTINIERSALALGGRIGPWSRVFELKDYTTGGIPFYILGNDNGGIKLHICSGSTLVTFA